MSGKIEISRDLLPCPFCGKDKTHFHHYSRKIGFDVYHCIRCYCCAETIGWTPEEAAQCWNTRAAPVVERQPDAYMTVNPNGMKALFFPSKNIDPSPLDRPLYTSQPAPVAVVLPEREESARRIKGLLAEIDRLKNLSGDPVAEITYTGYEPSNSVHWLNKGLHYMEPGTKLYAFPPRIVLPNRLEDAGDIQSMLNTIDRLEKVAYWDAKAIWNACLDKVKELNQ